MYPDEIISTPNEHTLIVASPDDETGETNYEEIIIDNIENDELS